MNRSERDRSPAALWRGRSGFVAFWRERFGFAALWRGRFGFAALWRGRSGFVALARGRSGFVTLARDRCGAVVVEAALLLPLMAIGAVAAIDVGRYLEATARADRMASGMADLVSRADVIRDRPVFDAQTRSTDTGAYFELARVMAEPGNLSDGGVVIASVTGAVGAATVNWMRASGDGATAAPERLADMPPLPAGMPFIVAEVFVPFQPLILDQTQLLGAVGFASTIYRRAVFRPRSAALVTLAPAS